MTQQTPERQVAQPRNVELRGGFSTQTIKAEVLNEDSLRRALMILGDSLDRFANSDADLLRQHAREARCFVALGQEDDAQDFVRSINWRVSNIIREATANHYQATRITIASTMRRRTRGAL